MMDEWGCPVSTSDPGTHGGRDLAALARERDDLLLLSESLVDVEAARTTDARLSILRCAIQRLGFRRVDMAEHSQSTSADSQAVATSHSVITDSGDLVVPLRAVDGTELAALVLGDALEPESLVAALRGCDSAFYLVHSMSSAGSFEASLGGGLTGSTITHSLGQEDGENSRRRDREA